MGMDDSFYVPLRMARRPQAWPDIVAGYRGPYEFPDALMMYPERPKRVSSAGSHGKKRRRATVIAEQDGKILLVREKDANRFSLPGGGIERGESVMEAAIRELREETGLSAVKSEYLFDHEGQTQNHKVVWALVRGQIALQKKELSEFKWWDSRENASLLDSAKTILDKFGNMAFR
jgi:8-oxo-dGTP diphosphatase